jgi:hypothetical protein
VLVALRPLERDLCAAVLRRKGLGEEEAARLARWSGGSPGFALSLRERGAAEIRERIDGVLAGKLDPLATAAEIGEMPGEYAGRTPAARARNRVRTVLDLALAVLADLSRAEAGIEPEALAHGDLVGRPGAGGPGTATPRRLELCLQARQDVEANLAPDAILERALLALEPGRRP